MSYFPLRLIRCICVRCDHFKIGFRRKRDSGKSRKESHEGDGIKRSRGKRRKVKLYVWVSSTGKGSSITEDST